MNMKKDGGLTSVVCSFLTTWMRLTVAVGTLAALLQISKGLLVKPAVAMVQREANNN